MTISKNEEPTETIFKEYLDYKRGFETNYLQHFSNITESYGSPFLYKFVTREVASCHNFYIGDCTKEVTDGYADCVDGYKCKYEIQEKL